MPSRTHPDPAEVFFDGPSKTQVKQAMHDLQDLGTALLALSANQLRAVPMEERLREALRQFGRMPTREAKRRHMQYIGRLLRETDSEPARQALEAIRAREASLLVEAERWRERLLVEDSAMTEWMKAHPAADAQPLRALLRKARRELAAMPEADPASPGARGKNRAYRELFQKIRSTLKSDENRRSQLAGDIGREGRRQAGSYEADHPSDPE